MKQFIKIIALLFLLIATNVMNAQCQLQDLATDLAEGSTDFKNLVQTEKGFDAWEIAGKHANLRINTTVLSKLNDIAGRGRGIDKAKLKAALDGDLGDVLNKATGDDLMKILNRLDTKEVTGAHLDEITSRLGNSDYGIKQDLLDHPEWFETFDDVLQEPGRYWDILAEGNLATSSPLAKWGQGKWWKNLRDFADNFETGAARSRFQTDLNIDTDKIVDQVTLEVNGTKIRIDYLGIDGNGKFHLGDAKFSTKDKNWSTDWLSASTTNQSSVYPFFKSGNVNSIVVKVSDAKKADLLLENLGLSNNSTIDFANSSLRIFGSDAGQTTVKSVVTIKN